MNAPGFRAALVAYIREQAKPVDKFSHQPRLYALTREVGIGQNYDDDVVFAAVWLHDLGVFVGHRPEEPDALAKWDCVSYAMKQTPAILKGLNFPAEKFPLSSKPSARINRTKTPPPSKASSCATRISWSSWARCRCCEPSARSGATRAFKLSLMR